MPTCLLVNCARGLIRTWKMSSRICYARQVLISWCWRALCACCTHRMLKAFPRRIINIHPSLLPKFPGLEAWKQALAAGDEISGCTVHYVDEKIDHGEIIAQREVGFCPKIRPKACMRVSRLPNASCIRL